MANATVRKLKPTIGTLIDKMSDLREQRRKLAEQDKALKQEYDAAEAQLIEMMDAEGTLKSSSRTATVSIVESVQFNTVDWDSFMAYVAKTKQFHLVQRRVSTPSVREVFEAKGAVPGLDPFIKREISLRNL